MPHEALCDFCSTLNFNAAGFYDNELLLNNTYPRNRSVRAILHTASSCIFCKQIVSVCRRWNICKDRDLASLQDAEAEAEIDIRRESTIWTIKDEEYLAMASVHHLTVEIIMKKERAGDPFTGFGPIAKFQRCEIPLHDVAEFLDGTVPLEGDQYQPHQGRLRPLVADLRLFRAWKDICAKSEPHQKACGQGAYPANLFLRLIDVKQRRIISGCHGLPFVALSYVWGTNTKPCLTKESLDCFLHPNALRQDNIPPTIFDAFTVTEALGERYLWVDSCCIIQDDEQDKLKYVSQMDLIYNIATVTIIASSGKSATYGLPGVRPDSRHCVQRPFIAKGLQLVETLSPGDYGGRESYEGEGLWKQRGWTFQERLLSRRCLVFTEEQVYWVCQKARFSEDRHAESPFVPAEIMGNGLFDDFDGQSLTFNEDEPDIYQDLAEQYASRTFKAEEDYFHGFLGVAKTLTRLTGTEFLWCLPLSNFTYMLCWCPLSLDDEIDRRRGSHLLIQEDGMSVRHPLPSWSWVGWYCELRWPPVSEDRKLMASMIRFYRISIQQNLQLVGGSNASMAGNGDLERPWMGAERVAAFENVPALVTANSLARVALTFWTSISRIKVDGGEVELLSKLRICGLSNDTKMQVEWNHIPFGITKTGSKSFYAVVVGDSGRKNHHSLDIMLVSWEDGVAYREGMLNINESDWLSLDREWKQVTLC